MEVGIMWWSSGRATNLLLVDGEYSSNSIISVIPTMYLPIRSGHIEYTSI